MAKLPRSSVTTLWQMDRRSPRRNSLMRKTVASPCAAQWSQDTDRKSNRPVCCRCRPLDSAPSSAPPHGLHHSSLCRNEVHRSRHLGSRVWSTGRPPRIVWASNPTHICSAMLAAISWRMTATIPAHCKRTWDTEISRTRPGIRRSRRTGSKGFGEISVTHSGASSHQNQTVIRISESA